MNKMNEMLEYDKIIQRLTAYALTQGGREQLKKMTPIMNEAELRHRLNDTTQARRLLDAYGQPPLAGTDKLRDYLKAAERGELLSMEELEQISRFTVQCLRMVRYLKRSEELNLELSGYGRGMADLSFIQEEIDRCIRNGRIDDQASKELNDIRRRISVAENSIRSKLEGLLKSKKAYFSEGFISRRNGHYTLPVKKEYKFQVPGSVIEMSASGATCFIEPTAVAKLRDEMNQLTIAESNEERRILYTLSGNVADFTAELKLNLDYIEQLDAIFAKGKLSAEMDGREAVIDKGRHISLKNARHPLLDKRTCVPLNMTFDEGISGIIITGPNTGGKTVALKTVGLCSLMAQSGLHVPCEEAVLCMNTQVLCDIGDNQSILENLSTFSSHIKNILQILKSVDHESLVLLDELGSGTDPAEGMGIAVAILDELKDSRCNFIATTHYPEVKEYASKTPGVINARMAFDAATLEPLYVLEVGEAGESCAFYIAKKLGMSATMLHRAYEAAYGQAESEHRSKQPAYGVEVLLEAADGMSEGLLPEKTDIKQTICREKEAPVKVTGGKQYVVGDSVMVYPQKKLGIVFSPANAKGEVGVQIQKQKVYVNHKRLQLKAAAKDLYPENYDFSIIFDSVEQRKLRHQMEKKHVEGLELRYNSDINKR